MSETIARKVEDLGCYEGSNAVPGIKFRHAARDLGVTAWRMNVLEMEPHCSGYPRHDHAADGQEEVYVVLKGSGSLHAGEQEWPLEVGTLVRVAPNVKRKLIAGANGVTVLALGATPGKAYAPRR